MIVRALKAIKDGETTKGMVLLDMIYDEVNAKCNHDKEVVAGYGNGDWCLTCNQEI